MENVKKNVMSIKQDVIDIVVNENGRPIPPGIILRKLKDDYQSIPNYNKVIYHMVDHLVSTGELKQLKNKSVIVGYVSAPVDLSKLKQGVISINSKGSGFITLDNEKKSTYYVFKTNLNGALNGDRVEFGEMQKPAKADLKDAIVTRVISHAKDFYVGIITFDENGNYKIKIDDEKFYLDVKLDSVEGLVTGQKILIHIGKYESKKAYGTVSRIIGHVDDVGVDILSIVYDNGVDPDFTDAILDYTKKMKLDVSEYQRKIRKDLTNLPIVTIDPATSKDFDDAIYVKRMADDKFYLSVSIADVSHYVKFKSILDEEALKRGCSIYLVDRVIPMLPHILSDDLCSLNPNVERLTLTCDMIINSVGQIQDIKVYPSIIKSHRRYSYDEVNAFFNKKDDLKNDATDVKQMLQEALELHHILDKAKKLRGYINFEIPQPIILVDEKCKPVEIKKYESGTAQKMIEDFMVAANEAVTIYAEKQKWPFVYRVHDKPSVDRLKTFSLEAKKLGFNIPTDLKNIQPNDIAK
jgi:ribonuclease R